MIGGIVLLSTSVMQDYQATRVISIKGKKNASSFQSLRTKRIIHQQDKPTESVDRSTEIFQTKYFTQKKEKIDKIHE